MSPGKLGGPLELSSGPSASNGGPETFIPGPFAFIAGPVVKFNAGGPPPRGPSSIPTRALINTFASRDAEAKTRPKISTARRTVDMTTGLCRCFSLFQLLVAVLAIVRMHSAKRCFIKEWKWGGCVMRSFWLHNPPRTRCMQDFTAHLSGWSHVLE